jgi:16S rRNA (guanine527-N7)-methyltransferase
MTTGAEIIEEKRLRADAATMGVELSANAATRCLAFLDLLEKWNRAFNLTAIRRREAMVTQHLLDSLAIVPWVRGPRVLDLGAGAGLPGIPLALARPDCHVVLLDSNRKKTRFLVQVAAELDLDNVEVVAARAEQYRPEEGFDTITARALAEIPIMLGWSAELLRAGGQFLFMKGTPPQAELEAVPAGFRVAELIPLQVPGLAAARHLVIIRPADGGAD